MSRKIPYPFSAAIVAIPKPIAPVPPVIKILLPFNVVESIALEKSIGFARQTMVCDFTVVSNDAPKEMFCKLENGKWKMADGRWQMFRYTPRGIYVPYLSAY